MAFSNQDKKNLTLMLEEPKKFLLLCESNSSIYQNLKNEFFQDGTGIFHLLLENILSNLNPSDKSTEYIKITKFLLENNFNLFQKKGNKPGSFIANEAFFNKISTDNLKFLFEVIQLNNLHFNEYNSPEIINLVKFVNFTKTENIELFSQFIKNQSYLFTQNKFIETLTTSLINSFIEKNTVTEVLDKIPQLSTNNYFLKNYIKFAVLYNMNDPNINQQAIDLLQPLFEHSSTNSYLKENIGNINFNPQVVAQKKHYNIYSFLLDKNNLPTISFVSQYFSKISFTGLLNNHELNIDEYNLFIKQSHFGTNLLNLECSNREFKYKLLYDIFSRLNDVDQMKWLTDGAHNHILNNISNKYTKFINNKINSSNLDKETINSESYDLNKFILEKIPSYFSNPNIQKVDKLILFKQILYYNQEIKGNTLLDRDNPYPDRFKKIWSIYQSIDAHIPKITNGFGSFYCGLSSLFLSLPNSGLDDDKEIECFCNLYQGLKSNGHEDYNPYIFSIGFFNSPKLVKSLFEKGFDIEKIPNLFQTSLQAKLQDNKENIEYELINPYFNFLNITKHEYIKYENAKETLHIINEKYPQFLQKSNLNLFSLILNSNNKPFNEFITGKQLAQIIPSELDISINFNKPRLNEDDNQTYLLLIEKIVNIKHPVLVSNFFSTPPFYQLISNFKNNEEIIDSFINAYNIDINKCQEDTLFWSPFNYSENSDLFISKITQSISENAGNHIINSFLDDNYLPTLNIFINKYPEFLNYHNDSKDNLLHIVSKNFEPKIIEFLLEKEPSLTQEHNLSKKLPLEYYLKNIIKIIEKDNYKATSSLKNQWDLLENFINSTFTKTDKKFKDKNLNKIHDLINNEGIKEIYPKISSTFLYHSLNQSIEESNNIIKIKKNKI